MRYVLNRLFARRKARAVAHAPEFRNGKFYCSHCQVELMFDWESDATRLEMANAMMNRICFP